MFGNLKSWFTSSAWPAIEHVFSYAVHTEVEVLLPIAKASLASLAAQELHALTTGDAKDTGHILARVVADTTAQAKDASLHSVLIAIGGALPAKK